MNTNFFGTDGIRKKVGVSPLTTGHLPRLGHAIGQWIIARYGINAQLLLAQDTRESSDFVKAALLAGLLTNKISVHDSGILPTPVACKLVMHSSSFHCALIISASHNIYSDNGIKIIDGKIGKISLIDEQMISDHFSEVTSLSYRQFGSHHFFEYGAQLYFNGIKQLFTTPFLQRKKIVIDCANGSTFHLAPEIFSFYGAHVIAIHDQPSGININEQCGSTAPASLQQAVIAHNADIGFAFDGDGDRLMIVNISGDIKNGDDILALLLSHPLYQNEHTIVGTNMSNEGFAYHLCSKGKQLERVMVGDKNVIERLVQLQQNLGGEPSGHIIMRDYMPISDSIVVALRILEVIEQTNNWELKTFDKFVQIATTIPFQEKMNLDTQPIRYILDSYKKKLPKGRIIVRYSGTEDILRILVEDHDHTKASVVSEELTSFLSKHLTTKEYS